MKIKSLMYVLMGTMLVTTSCSDNELEKGNDGSGTVDPVNASTPVSYTHLFQRSFVSLVTLKDSSPLCLIERFFRIIIDPLSRIFLEFIVFSE